MNVGFTPATPPADVIDYLTPMLSALASLLAQACRNARKHFDEKGWSWDANLAAFEVRKEVLEEARKLDIDVYEDWNIEKKSLCGLLVKTPLAELKIRKSSDGEIPPAGSATSQSFYQWNLLVFPQNDPSVILPLHLLLLWNDNAEGLLDSMFLACVEGETWRWREVIALTDLRRTSETDAENFRQSFYAEDVDIDMEMKQDPAVPSVEQPAEEEHRSDENGEEKKKA